MPRACADTIPPLSGAGGFRMIPLIGLLLSIYLIFKGVEIYMLYRTSARTDGAGYALAVLSLAAAIIIGGFFALAFITSGNPTPPARMP